MGVEVRWGGLGVVGWWGGDNDDMGGCRGGAGWIRGGMGWGSREGQKNDRRGPGPGGWRISLFP